MISEIARIGIDPLEASAFEAAVVQAARHFRSAPGCRSFRLERSVDRPGEYMLVVGWDSVEAHMVDFRQSPAFQQWRALAGPFFNRAPEVDHVETAVESF